MTFEQEMRRQRSAMRAVYTDPKFVASVEWLREYGIGSQIERQYQRPDRRVALVFHEMPDFDWWEPRYDQPGRRERARYRDLGI